MKRLLLVAVFAVALLALLATPALAASTITVHPAGRAADVKYNADTVNIQKAFTEAGPRGTVQLSAGHFYMNNILVTGFNGYFKGSGEGATVIDCLRGLNRRLPGITVTPGHDAPSLLTFQDGTVRVSDMSFDITAAAPAEPWSAPEFGGPNDYLMNPLLMFGESSAAVDRVSFKGHAGDFFGMNTDNSVLLEADATQSSLIFAMTRCTCATLEGVGNSGPTLDRARITIGGNASQGNVFHSAGVGCHFIALSDSDIVISHNQFRVGNDLNGALYSAAVEATAFDDGGTASRYLVSRNTMLVAPPADGVDLWDYGTWQGVGTLIDAVVSANTIVLSGSLDLDPSVNAAGIGEVDAQDIQVLNNRISGTGLAGIYLGIPLLGDDSPGSVSGWKIIGNNVGGVTALVAPIWLGPGTIGCTVIGGCAPTRVLDEGTDNHLINVITLPQRASALSTISGGAAKLAFARRLH
jgi:hypothetical protein